jgi:hypothetical protein
MGLHPENQANGRWRRSARASFRLSVLTLRLVSGFAVIGHWLDHRERYVKHSFRNRQGLAGFCHEQICTDEG